MDKKVNKCDLSKILYIFGAELYIALRIIGDANFNVGQSILFSKINNILSLLVLVVLSGSLVSQFKKLTYRKLFFIGAFIVLELLIQLNNGQLLPLSLFLLIAAYPITLNLKEFAYVTYRIMFLSILFVMIGFWLGIFQDSVIYGHSVERHSLGFVTANSYANKIIILLFIRLCYAWNKRWKWYAILIWILLISYTYFYANSRASFYFGILVIVLVLGERYKILSPRLKKVLYKIPIFIFSVSGFLTLSSMLYFSSIQNNMYNLINNMVSGRLYYITLFYQNYGLKLLGTKNVKFVSYSEASKTYGLLQWLGIDNSYAYIAIVNGLVVLVVFGIMYYFSQKKAYEDRNLGIAIYLSLFAVMGLTENYMANYALNFSIFVFAAFLTSKNKSVESSEIIDE